MTLGRPDIERLRASGSASTSPSDHGTSEGPREGGFGSSALPIATVLASELPDGKLIDFPGGVFEQQGGKL